MRARATIAELGARFIRHGACLLVHGHSRVVLSLLRRAIKQVQGVLRLQLTLSPIQIRLMQRVNTIEPLSDARELVSQAGIACCRAHTSASW